MSAERLSTPSRHWATAERMRGCLTFLVVVALLVGVGGWFLLPPATGALVGTGLVVSGLRGTDTKVEVSADPPFELLTGHADSVSITSSSATWGQLSAATLEVNLSDVGLVDRTFDRIDGRLTGVSLADDNGATIGVSSVILGGTRQAPTATLGLSSLAVELLVGRAVASELPATPERVRLQAPDRLVLEAASRSVTGRLAIDAGALVLRLQGVGTVSIYDPGQSAPFRLRSVSVTADELSLGASINLVALGLAG
jgi:hypothetical protein